MKMESLSGAEIYDAVTSVANLLAYVLRKYVNATCRSMYIMLNAIFKEENTKKIRCCEIKGKEID